MDYKVTWLDSEMGILGDKVYTGDEWDLVTISEHVANCIERDCIPAGTAQFTVELHHQ